MYKGFCDDTKAVVDANAGIAIGILIASLMVIGFIVYSLQAQILSTTTLHGANLDRLNNTVNNISGLLDTSVGLIIIVVVVALLALALLVLISLRKKTA